MAEMNDIVKLAVDAYNHKTEKFSVDESLDTLRQALVSMNGGKTEITYKDVRAGRAEPIFALVEEILQKTVSDGLQGDEYFNSLVDFRNLKLGDKNEFVVENANLFTVSDVADGIQGVRRQRLIKNTVISIETVTRIIKIYEELNMVLAGRIDFNKFIERVGESFKQKMLNDIYSLWYNATSTDFKGSAYFPAAGSYSEDTLLDTIAHVEAAAGGKKATIIGTQKTIRHLAPSVQGTDSKSDLYNMGYYGNFYGTPVVAVPQRHKVNSTTFVFEDNVIDIIAGDEKPIKFVYEGDPTIVYGDPYAKDDLTQEYTYIEKYGLGIVMNDGNGGIGRYKVTSWS